MDREKRMPPGAMFSPGQCRAARGLVGWSQEDLAEKARVEPETVELYEAGGGQPSRGDWVAMGLALYLQGGVKSISDYIGGAGEGVRFRNSSHHGARTGFAHPCDPRPIADDADLGEFELRGRRVG